VLTEHSVAEVAATCRLPVPARYVETTGSTNTDLMAAADAGAPDWSVLVAGHQTAGRGRMGRSWEAPPGSSLLLSVLLRPSIDPSRAPVLSLFAAITMAQAIEDTAGVGVACEWPNDLLTPAGCKLGGVLLESQIAGGRLLHVVIGVGVNLTQAADDFPRNLRLPATSLSIEGASGRPEVLLRSFLYRLHERLELDADYFAPWVISTYRRRCATIGRTVRAMTVDGTVIEGEASDIGPNGELIVTTAAGDVSVASGEVERLD
jgi:BirA family biotin operon repressor/biotin-[acetyl-CoA-carboxylase] ligase